MNANGRNGKVSNKDLDEVKEEMFDDEVPPEVNAIPGSISYRIRIPFTDRNGVDKGFLSAYVTCQAPTKVNKKSLKDQIQTLVDLRYPLAFYLPKNGSGGNGGYE